MQQITPDQSRPKSIWSDKAREFITWDKLWTNVSDVIATAEIKWFVDAKLNVSKSVLTVIWNIRKNRHYLGGDNPKKTEQMHRTFEEVCRFSNALKDVVSKKGDRSQFICQ